MVKTTARARRGQLHLLIARVEGAMIQARREADRSGKSDFNAWQERHVNHLLFSISFFVGLLSTLSVRLFFSNSLLNKDYFTRCSAVCDRSRFM